MHDPRGEGQGRNEAERLFAGASDMARRMRAFDWAKTSIGPPEFWPQSLKAAVRIMLTSRQPIWIGWGEELIYFYNDPYKSIIGGKDAWALGRPTSEVWREIWDDISPLLSKAMRGDEGTYVEEQLLIMERHGYPEETYYTFSYSPIPNDDGDAGGIICANVDDTQRVIGERQLALLRELATGSGEARTWQQACERSAQALSTDQTDLPFALIYIARPGADSLTLAGASGLAAGHPAAPPEIALFDTSIWPVGEVLTGQKMLVVSELRGQAMDSLPSGPWRQRPHQAALVPIAAAGEMGRAGVLVAGLNPFRVLDDAYRGFLELAAGQIAAAIGNAQAYEDERKRAESLAELDKAKTTFFSNISHEFRTPLTLLLGPLEDLLARRVSESVDQHQLVSLAHRNGLRLLKLVNALLEFSRIEAGRLQGNYQPFDLASLTRDLASNFRSAMDKAGLRYVVDCGPLARPVHVDRDMWEKIVLNLLSNAFKFTFEGEIVVRLREDGDFVVLEVTDTGTGIPEAELPHLFERFHRVEGAHGRSFEGSGIGLALVQELVKLHGGDIGVTSRLDEGSTFAVRIPFGRAQSPAHEATSTERPSMNVRAHAYVDEVMSWLDDGDAQATPSASSPEDLALPEAQDGQKGKLVLLVDDNLDMRQYVSRLLTTAGYRVAFATDGHEGYEMARRSTPDLILSDVMMPGLDGFGLVAKLREDGATRTTPVILLSARAGEEAKVEGIRSGADDYLIKPFSARELLARVEANLELAGSRRATARVLREETEILEQLNKVGTAVAAELDLEAAVQVVTDAATRLTGAAFGAFFYNVINEAREAYTLYTLSGVPREAFSKFPMPRNTDVFRPTFEGEGVVRSDDITLDPRYGRSAPHKGMPEGHLPVRSYLAVPVVARSGEVLGGLFFGHPEPGKFDDRSERIITAIAVQAAIAIEKARLYRAAQIEIERRIKIETALRDSEQSLERKVAERTAELAAANDQLIAEAAERRKAEGSFQQLVEGVTDYAVFMLDPNGMISSWNKGAERIKGYLPGEIIGQYFGRFYTEEDRSEGIPEQALACARDTGRFEAEGWRVRKDGSHFWANVLINRVCDTSGAIVGFAKVTRDTTERREAQLALQRAQEQLAQAQKMEGIGQLTGGVAHDFNNLLTIIMGNLETLQRTLKKPPPDQARMTRSVDNALRGAQRAAALTQRLLAFSRRQPLDPKAIDVSRLVSGMSDLLRRTLGEQIAIETVLAGGLWRALADPNQLEIAILNLAVNARDAMPRGGKLTIETANAYLDEAYSAALAEVVPGQYVVICITDTGTGMSKEIIARAFEPFFTTKDIGQGTGLGLSQVYGFVKQSGGHVKIYSEPEQGTTVKLYLPRLHGEGDAAADIHVIDRAPSSCGSETVLVVEDEDDVRAHSTEILRELGYVVLEAPNAQAALRILAENPQTALLFTDVGLPGGMNGRHLSDEARRRRPDLKVLFTTGYARNAIVHDGRLDPGVQLITKPFTYAGLAAKLRDVLDARAGPPRILLVEDDVPTLGLATEYLEAAGYKVESAVSAMDAVNRIRLVQGAISVAIVNVGLPDGQGEVLISELRTIYPDLAIVAAGGSDETSLRERFQGDRRLVFLGKPYTQAGLLEAVRSLT